MKRILIAFLLMAGPGTVNAQTHGKTADGKDVLINADGTWQNASGVPNAPDVDRGCVANSTGSVRLVNNNATLYAKGRICLKHVNAKTGNVYPPVWEEFNLSPGKEVIYKDVLIGIETYKYAFWQDQGYSNEQTQTVYIAGCQLNEAVIR
jgi:hypothetical protein